MCAMVCELLSGDRKCTRWFASLSQEIEIHPVHFLRRFCGANYKITVNSHVKEIQRGSEGA